LDYPVSYSPVQQDRRVIRKKTKTCSGASPKEHVISGNRKGKSPAISGNWFKGM